jgi:hypothetical protein
MEMMTYQLGMKIVALRAPKKGLKMNQQPRE